METNASLGHTLLDNTRILISPVYCRWDEWVPAARLLKYNETNLELAKTLKNASTASTSKSAHKSAYLNLRDLITRLISFSSQRAAPGGPLVPEEPLPLEGRTAVVQRGGEMRTIQTGDLT